MIAVEVSIMAIGPLAAKIGQMTGYLKIFIMFGVVMVLFVFVLVLIVIVVILFHLNYESNIKRGSFIIL